MLIFDAICNFYLKIYHVTSPLHEFFKQEGQDGPVSLT